VLVDVVVDVELVVDVVDVELVVDVLVVVVDVVLVEVVDVVVVTVVLVTDVVARIVVIPASPYQSVSLIMTISPSRIPSLGTVIIDVSLTGIFPVAQSVSLRSVPLTIIVVPLISVRLK